MPPWLTKVSLRLARRVAGMRAFPRQLAVGVASEIEIAAILTGKIPAAFCGEIQYFSGPLF